MHSDDELTRLLAATTTSIDACVVVGGTLLRLHHDGLASAIGRGALTRFIFPAPDSAWLAPMTEAAGVRITEYGARISRNAERAQGLGPTVQVRWSRAPVTTWFVIADRTTVVHKPIDFLSYATPTLGQQTGALTYYSRLFESLWSESVSDPRQTDPRPVKAAGPLRIFLCHSSVDKPQAIALFETLRTEGFDPWLDVKSLLPGQDWRLEVSRAVKAADVIIVCLSLGSVDRRGYMQKEITIALDVAEEYPEGVLYVLPVRLNDCPLPDRLAHLHTVDISSPSGHAQLLLALRLRAEDLPHS